jgi:nitrogen PTS system EIIA component
MSLASLLSAEQIIPEMKATDRWPAIVELIDILVSLGKIKSEDRDSILASLKQREETMSTGIGFGIAIPHPTALTKSWPHLDDRPAGLSSMRSTTRR